MQNHTLRVKQLEYLLLYVQQAIYQMFIQEKIFEVC